MFSTGQAVRLNGGDRRALVVGDRGVMGESKQPVYVLMDRSGRQVFAWGWQLRAAADVVQA